LEKLAKGQEKIERELGQEKEIVEERILKTTLPLEIKEKILKDIKIITATNTKGMERKIAGSPIDLNISKAAIENLTKELKQKGEVYQKLLAEVKKQQEKTSDFKEKNKQCKNCQKYCSAHEKKTQKVMSEHETCKHCHKYDKQIQQSKEKLEKLTEKLEKLKKTKPGASKEIQKLVNDLKKEKKQNEKMRHEAFGNRTKCLILNKLKSERKDCLKCQEQKQKKYRAPIENPLQRVCLFDKNASPEVYLLSNEAVCCYNKKDLATFLEGEGKTKSLLKDKERGITDIKFYSIP
jgi:DNA repair exonuclease SbcCD ATPase subunit